MSIFVWTLKRGSVRGYPVRPTAILEQLQRSHIVSKNRDFLSASSWNTRCLPRTLSATMTSEIPTSTRANTMDAMNHSRLTTRPQWAFQNIRLRPPSGNATGKHWGKDTSGNRSDGNATITSPVPTNDVRLINSVSSQNAA